MIDFSLCAAWKCLSAFHLKALCCSWSLCAIYIYICSLWELTQLFPHGNNSASTKIFIQLPDLVPLSIRTRRPKHCKFSITWIFWTGSEGNLPVLIFSSFTQMILLNVDRKWVSYSNCTEMPSSGLQEKKLAQALQLTRLLFTACLSTFVLCMEKVVEPFSIFSLCWEWQNLEE